MAAYMGLIAGAFSQYWQSDYHWFYQRYKFFHHL